MRNRTAMREMLTALLVLALVFLNFGHQAPAVAYSADLTPYLVADGIAVDAPCARHPLDHPGHDTTCHLCRLGAGLDLPPPPCAALDAPLAAQRVSYAPARDLTSGPAIVRAADARAPPALSFAA